MDSMIYGLLYGPLIIGLLLTLITINIKKIPQLIALGSSLLTGIVSTYLFLMTFISTIDPSFITVLTIYTSPNGNSLLISLQLDSLSRFMVFVASFLGMLIVFFSIEYMKGDKELGRYYFFIQLFIISMMILVSAGDFLMMFVGWELVGLCSFFLIAHWYSKEGLEGEKCAQSGMKAFIFTRFGDIGFLMAIVYLYANFGSLTFSDLVNVTYTTENMAIIGVFFVIAAFGKSAQLPFMPWLSSPDNVDIDAMQGPTTVSALIHAATMVKAGIYLISRMFLIFPLGLSVLFGSWSIIVIIAGLTAVIAGLSAVMSEDIKRILAYSTVSQLSYMFLIIGLAYAIADSSQTLATDAFYATQLHLFAHAFFKSLLFLSAGYIIHTYHSRKLSELRGVLSWEKEKIVLISFVIGCLALVGLPPMNGFFSKEAIVGVSYEIGFVDGLVIGQIAFIFVILTAIITALYTSKLLVSLTFKDISTTQKNVALSHEEHSSHQSIFMPGIILIIAILTVVGSIFSFVAPGFFSDVITEQTFEILKASDILIPIITLTIIIISLLLAMWLLNTKPDTLNDLSKVVGINIIVNLSRNGFYFERIISWSWKKFLTITNRVKYIHTGDLNYTVLFMSSFSFIIVVAFLLGGT